MGAAVYSPSDVAHTSKPVDTIDRSLMKRRELPAETVVPSRLPPNPENGRSTPSASFTTLKKS